MKRFAECVSRFLEIGGIKKEIALLGLSGVALILSLAGWSGLPLDPAWVAIILCGIPILLEAMVGLITAFDIKADVLVSMALIASVCIGEYFAAGEVALIMQLGALLEDLTVAKARAGIERLVRLTPQNARILDGETERLVPASTVKVGDHLRVLPGEGVPVDGVVTAGRTSVNQAVMTGESLPVDKGPGDEVLSGTVNQFGVFEMRASRVGADSSIQRMIRLVQSADAGKAKIVGMADRWATWVVVVALAAALLTWAITGDILRAVTILVVFCPCALVLATPTAIMAAIGNATAHGFLVREGDALERLAAVSRIALDKTGTLTFGTPQVTEVKSLDPRFSESDLFRLAAAAEQFSEHPIGKAVLSSYCQTDAALPAAANFELLIGRGVRAEVGGDLVFAGNGRMMREMGIHTRTGPLPDGTGQAGTVVYIAVNRELAGYLQITDSIRPESAGMISSLKANGVVPVLLSGDHEVAVSALANRLKIEEAHGGCLPEDKLRYIESCQRAKQAVCMLGDGINDAPALKAATVGIAMGGIGSDIAMDAADIVLVDDEVKELPHLFALSRRMMSTIKLNLCFSMGLNFLAIALAIASVLNPISGALVHNAGSVLVILNSALLLRWKKK